MKLYTSLQAWAVAMRPSPSDRGAGMAEYALLLVLIAIACVVAVTALGTQVSTVFNNITNDLGNTPAGP